MTLKFLELRPSLILNLGQRVIERAKFSYKLTLSKLRTNEYSGSGKDLKCAFNSSEVNLSKILSINPMIR